MTLREISRKSEHCVEKTIREKRRERKWNKSGIERAQENQTIT